MANRIVQRFAALVAVLGLVGGALAGDDACEPGWVDGQFLPATTTDLVRAIGEFEVGSQSAFFIGGRFTTLQGGVADYVACWNDEQWEPLLGPSGLGITPLSSGPILHQGVRALASFDDGDGPALYAAGEFESADGQIVNNIARWDGASWSPLSGPDGIGVDGRVACLYVFDDGSGPALYVGGEFSHAGGIPAERIARWDGAAWSALIGENGSGIEPSGSVNSIISFDDGSGDALFVAGAFLSADGVSTNRIASWNGGAWRPLEGDLGQGVNGVVNDLAVYGNDFFGFFLYVAGEFTEASGIECRRIAKWDGTEWSAVIDAFGIGANGTDDDVLDLEVFNDGSGAELYLVGRFERAGNRNVCGFSKWDGFNFAEPNFTDLPGFVFHPYSCATALAMGTGSIDGQSVLCISHYSFGAGEDTIRTVLVWDGEEVSQLAFPSPRTGLEDSVYAVEQFGDGPESQIYAGGFFRFAGGQRHNRIARWDGAAWSPLTVNNQVGVSGEGSVHVLHAMDKGNDPSLFVGGLFQSAGGETMNNISRWDGTAWHPLISDGQVGIPSGGVYSLGDFDDGEGPALYVGGEFGVIGSQSMNGIARWDGEVWSPLDGPFAPGVSSLSGNANVYAMAVFDDGTGEALYIGGRFDLAGGVEVYNIAKWDGTKWSALRGPLETGIGGTEGWVSAMTVYDDGSGPALYVGGHFLEAGGVLVNNIARWDGSAWTPLASARAIGVDGGVSSLSTMGDTSSEVLLAGGSFKTGGERILNGLGRWNGVEWLPFEGPSGVGVGGSTNEQPAVRAISPFDNGEKNSVFVAGSFTHVGGQPSAHFAEWRECRSEPCPADITGDGSINLADLNLVLANFGQTTDSGDTNGDGAVDLSDLNAILAAFGTSCQ